MDLRLLEYFVAVAELEHVGKAAERLHISQSPLSRQIRQLETDLNLQLFIRERQRIRLSDAGRWLLIQAQGLLAHSQKIRNEAEQRARGELGTLSVAFTSAAMWSGALPDLFRRFQARFRGATVHLQNMRSGLQVDAVHSGRIDVGFVSVPATSGDLEVTCVAEEPSVLVIPAAHPILRKRRLGPRDLDGIGWILLSESLAPREQDRFFAACTRAGFTPRVAQRVTEPISLLALVESGLGVGLIRGSARNYAPRSLTFKHLPWFSFKSRTFMIRPPDGRTPMSDAFALMCHKLPVRASAL